MAKFDPAILNQASKQAMQDALLQTAKQRLDAAGSPVFAKIIDHLKSVCTDKSEVAALEQEINKATNKNEVILNVLKKGGAISDCIRKFLRI